MCRRFQLAVLSFVLILPLAGQDAPFDRGVNLTNWFQANSAQEIPFGKYTLTDFEQIQSLGCDVIRLPINLHAMAGPGPGYTLDPLFLEFLDQAVDWAETVGIHLILDNHTFDPASDTPTDIDDVLLPVWEQMANHFKDRSDLILYEVLNEPHGINDALWGSIQGQVIDRIRSTGDTHTIVVGPASWNSYHNLHLLPDYPDDNLLYTFHFYDPFLFTHQGASWTGPSMAELGEVPFPYTAGAMPPLPGSLAGTWIAGAYNDYATQGNVARVQELIDIAADFRDQRQVPLFCGEFGVYIPNSPADDRVYWYQIVREYLEASGIAWTCWDYHGGFGLFNAGGNDLFDHDLNTGLLEALGLDIPPQTPFFQQPDTTGFIIFDDQFGARIFAASYGDGQLNYYNDQQPNYGQRCIYWANPTQYNAIGFDFSPNRDLSQLRSEGYMLDLFVRGDTPGAGFNIRFLDTKTSEPNDHPWRIRIVLDDQNGDPAWDLSWQHLQIPLIDFQEHGAWDNNTWYNPIGAFDWTAIDKLEIVTEQAPPASLQLWFDQLQITELDTALVNDPTVLVPVHELAEAGPSWRIYPNPVRDQLYLQADQPTENAQLTIYALNGQPVLSKKVGDYSLIMLRQLPAGLYLVRVREPVTGREWTGKMQKTGT